ncbi:MAG: hypothetical protein PVJ39_19770, partial [Gammaproteobacteria bacterium]
NSYSPSVYEIALGVGGFAFAIFIVMAAVKILKFLPLSLDNTLVDPHYRAEEDVAEPVAGEQASA